MLRRAAFLGAICLLLAPTWIQPNTATADQLINAALKDDAGLHRLEYLCDRIGNRLSGSKALEDAVTWSVEEMSAWAGQRAHHSGEGSALGARAESAEMVEPLAKPLHPGAGR